MTDKELDELKNIRKLLMLLVYKTGASQDEIATALGISTGRVSQMLPSKGIKLAQVKCLTMGEQQQE